MNDKAYAKALTAVIRVMGVLALIISPMAFLGAVIDADNRTPSIVAGVLLLAIGIGCLRGTALTADQIDKFRKG